MASFRLDKNLEQRLDYLAEITGRTKTFYVRIALLPDPRSSGKSLKSSFSGLWRYRIGDYRAICRIEDERLVVLVLRIAH